MGGISLKKKNKLLTFFIIFAMIIPSFTKIVLADIDSNEYISVIPQNIRVLANDTAKPVVYLDEGESVQLIESANNDWFKVKYKDEVGYVYRGDVTSAENYHNLDREFVEVDVDQKPDAKETYIITLDVNLRTRNTNHASSLKLMKQGSEVTYKGTTKNDWFLVEHEGTLGYVYRGDVTSPEAYGADREFHNVPTKIESKLDKLRVIIDRNLRTKDEDNYGAILTLKRGDIVTYKGTTKNGWFLVDYNGTKGYIYRGDVTSEGNGDINPDTGETNPSDEEITVTKPNGLEYVTTANLHLRTGNTTSHKSLKLLSKGSTVKHLGTTDNGWFKVDYNGTIGFVSSEYLKEKKVEDSNNNQDESNPSDNIVVSKPNGKEYVTISDLNIRTGNGASYDRISTIPKGASVKHLGTADNNWFKVDYNGIIGFVSSRYLKEKISDPALKGAMVFLDYGHGGPDSGAIGTGGRLEKDDALRVGLLTAEKLRSRGVIVDEARASDPNKKLELFERTNMANRKNYHYFVSIHRNAFNGSANGVETFTHPNSSKKAKDLATQVQRNLVRVGFLDRKTKQANFYVLRNTKAPAILVEVGFIDNKNDNWIFDTKLNNIAEAMADGIITEIQRNK